MFVGIVHTEPHALNVNFCLYRSAVQAQHKPYTACRSSSSYKIGVYLSSSSITMMKNIFFLSICPATFLYHFAQSHVTLAVAQSLVHDIRYTRRDRSRSRSHSPVRRRDRGGYRRPSPRRSRSPAEQTRRDLSNKPPRSGHGGGGPDHRGGSPPVNRGRSRSRSKSRDPSRSRSPEAAPAKRESSRYNRRRSSSSRSSSPDGNKGLVSY